MHTLSRRISAGTAAPHASRDALARVGVLAIVLVATSLIGYKLGWFDYRHTLEHVARLRRSYGVGAFTIGFVLVFGVASALGVPGLPLTVVAGLLFGTLLGTVLSWVGGMLGAAGGYWIARTIGHDVVSHWLKRFKRVDAAVADACNFGGMLRLRLIPVLPLGITNFVGGLAHARFLSYMAATAIGIVPATIIYTYFADSFLEGVEGGQSGARMSLLIASILMIGLSLLPKLFRKR